MFKMWNCSLSCKSKKLFYRLSYYKIKANFRYLLLPWYVYLISHERLPCTYFTITIFYCWDNVLFNFFVFFSFYRHSFIQLFWEIVTISICSSVLHLSFITIKLQVEISLSKRTSRALGLIITLSWITKCSKVLLV